MNKYEAVTYSWFPMFLIAYIVGFYMYFKTVDIWLSSFVFALVQISMVYIAVYLYC